jgi:hypothetical protein
MKRFLILLPVFVFAYIFVSAALSATVLAVNETNETTTTTTVPNETTTTITTTTTTSTTTTTTTTLPDTTAPTVGSVSPVSVIQSEPVTLTATVSDDTGVVECDISIDDLAVPGDVSNELASATLTSGLEEGSYSVYFICYDAAGNAGEGQAVTVTSAPAQLSASLTLEKETYYPTDTFNPRVKVTAPDGEIIIGATVWGKMTYADQSIYMNFYYSTLCDCYKAWYYFSESTLPNDYTLTVTSTYPGYDEVSVERAFSVAKPGLNMEMSVDKTEYFSGDSVKLTIRFTDDLGNAVNPDSRSGEMRYADTGELVSLIYSWRASEGVYYYTYYFSSSEVDKSYIISTSAKWKEQEASDSITISVTMRGLNGDIGLEKDVLTPGDILQGKVKVFDKYGNTISDARVSIRIKDAQGNMYRYLSTEYSEGFYEIDAWTVDEWIAVGEYTLYAEISKGDESITVEKKLEIRKEKLNVQVSFDQSSYSPGGRMYIKVLVTYPDGTIVEDAYVGGEIFPLGETSSEAATESASSVTGAITAIKKIVESITGSVAAVTAAEPETITIVTPEGIVTSVRDEPMLCRIYFHPEGPIYYKGSWIQKYYIDDSRIPDWCPTGKYVLRLTVSAPGYADTTIEKEFDVALAKLLLETGFKIDSSLNYVNLYIYAEVKDDTGSVVPYVNIMGYLHPLESVESTEGQGCVKRVRLGYDEFINRYSTQVNLQKYECPAGVYLLEIAASQSSYETAKVEQSVPINYTEDYEYSVIVPPVVGQEPMVCREVSCGPECFNKICSMTAPVADCFEEVVDKECMMECTDRAAGIDESASKGEAVGLDMASCVESCKSNIPCRGSGVTRASDDEMMQKLEEIYGEVSETRKGVQLIIDALNSLIEMLKNLLGGVSSSRITTSPAPTITQPLAEQG